MDVFYTTVLAIALVILILILTYIGIIMLYYKPKQTFPPSLATCPDYWQVYLNANGDSSGCIVPRGTPSINTGIATEQSYMNAPGYKGAGTSLGQPYINFNDTTWNTGGKPPICNQKVWANRNQIVWDGVTNYNGC